MWEARTIPEIKIKWTTPQTYLYPAPWNQLIFSHNCQRRCKFLGVVNLSHWKYSVLRARFPVSANNLRGNTDDANEPSLEVFIIEKKSMEKGAR